MIVQIDAFVQLLYANKAEDWQIYMATRGKTAELIEGNLQLGRPSYLSDQVPLVVLPYPYRVRAHKMLHRRSTLRSAMRSSPTGSGLR